jgi:hypothetical protein
MLTRALPGAGLRSAAPEDLRPAVDGALPQRGAHSADIPQVHARRHSHLVGLCAPRNSISHGVRELLHVAVRRCVCARRQVRRAAGSVHAAARGAVAPTGNRRAHVNFKRSVLEHSAALGRVPSRTLRGRLALAGLGEAWPHFERGGRRRETLPGVRRARAPPQLAQPRAVCHGGWRVTGRAV